MANNAKKRKHTHPTAIAKMVKLTPSKARLVADLVRGKDVEDAFNILRFTNKKASRFIEKVVQSAVANAVNDEYFNFDEDKLYIEKITIDEGPKLKRMRPRAMGRADVILKKTSHITVVLNEKKEG
ncbi:MAG: 50S ribosomal protein L22 [Fusobacteria bacterium]|jgi:large subunit ribosomal protein L22|nr:50S ribosomal protein L22 [Fusobacteriota bacterium]